MKKHTRHMGRTVAEPGLLRFAIIIGCVSLLSIARAGAQTTIITQWNFSSAVPANDNSPAPTTGSGVAVSLGMTNTDTYAGTTATNSVTADDITATAGTADASFSADLWRIRGAYVATGVSPNSGTPSKSGNVNGWNLSAPPYTQGAEFDVSTVGYTGITVGYLWYDTSAGITDLQEQYNLNINNSSGWTNINPLQVAVPNDYVGGATPTTLTINLSGVIGASNDANLGIRLVSAYNPSFGDGTEYTSGTGASTAEYDNNSGNWRFGDITFEGQAIPEPSTYAGIFSGFCVIMGFRHFRRRRSLV
jgi:hypothetical protein